MKITIEHNVIKSLLLIAGKGDIRYYLNSVCVDARANGDVVLVATDGHRLLAYPVAVDDIESLAPGEYVIPREALAAVKPAKGGKKSFPITITTTPEKSVTIIGATTLTTPLVDGKFPDWRRVMPKSVSGEPAQYDAEYVGDFGKVCLLLGSKFAAPRINHNGAGAAAITNLDPAGRILGVLMPQRDEGEAAFTGLPAWARAE